MKANLFFRFLNEGYVLEAQKRLHDIRCSIAPHANEESRRQIVRAYERQATDMMDTLEPFDDYTAISELKQNL